MCRNFTLFLILSLLFSNQIFSQKRIINGTPVSPPALEWLAGLSNSTDPADHFCGGSLIAPQWVVTAAHCVEGETPQTMKIFFKAYYLSNPVTGYFSVAVDSIFPHPNFDNVSYDNDVALVKLKTPATGITPIKLIQPAQTTLIATGKNQTTAGWGLTSNTGFNSSDTLLKTTVPIVATATCNAANAYNGEITSNMLCAGYMAGGSDACQGDSGGPLFTTDSLNNQVLTGVVSWGEGCAEPNFPGVYTKLANYYTWITNKTGVISSLNEVRELLNVSTYYKDNSIFVSSINGFQSVEIFDLQGRLVSKTAYPDVQHQAQVANLNLSGFYFISVRNGVKFATTKIICQ
jgi:secreted trypsin-like serine protease